MVKAISLTYLVISLIEGKCLAACAFSVEIQRVLQEIWFTDRRNRLDPAAASCCVESKLMVRKFFFRQIAGFRCMAVNIYLWPHECIFGIPKRVRMVRFPVQFGLVLKIYTTPPQPCGCFIEFTRIHKRSHNTLQQILQHSSKSKVCEQK